ncbi:MAG: hypothetical protein Pg6B_04950 [Candidatus Azobacteroides pseudotrichonymphae]|jgi:hypothetical protein|nr:hypothetical protein [Bacteroidales bacterium OttesenSCG-928-I14]GMO34726.1 MAG: hypothetical protein Pg6B_04950 [Candidatus Azobacteroides pseudotrichonymphae]
MKKLILSITLLSKIEEAWILVTSEVYIRLRSSMKVKHASIKKMIYEQHLIHYDTNVNNWLNKSII